MLQVNFEIKAKPMFRFYSRQYLNHNAHVANWYEFNVGGEVWMFSVTWQKKNDNEKADETQTSV